MPVLAFETRLTCPPTRVFAALTQSVHLAHWFADLAESEPRLGGALIFRWTGPRASAEPYVARWVQLDAPRACAYQGGHAGYPGGDAGRIAYALDPDDEGTRLITLHTLPDRPEYEPFAERYRAAWPRALARLGAYLASAADRSPGDVAARGLDPLSSRDSQPSRPPEPR